MYIAVSITPDSYWVVVSKPSTKELAEAQRGCQLDNERFEVKTLQEVLDHKKVLGHEYIN